MAKLPSMTPKVLVKILESLNFRLDHSAGSHHIFYNSKTKRRAVVPSHKKDLPKGTIMSILKEAGITKQELENFLK
ncbi:MAG: hypothetical protein A2998_00605 [Candidatus Staskawiczbacteria bacterium RIFCSPLOWO2_01_FULL_37_25b]|uniref:Toxin HicA n=1 Tax=Candidatus Staskawiczbacteria bacterium RIFCSPLOWO2_01_FULL_37_25b TaxID=1802213 RepID=A0A1G2IC58_9BACT|nr:MAG: hypothetical protein A2998_00605 [Candidatus Staskawiczbacteria bacterium RIFCSPLOWO2_01_FULL_37_25b]